MSARQTRVTDTMLAEGETGPGAPSSEPEATVLLVDRNDDDRARLRSMLIQGGYAVFEAQPGEAARTDEALLATARVLGTTIFHPVGTAKMGPTSDPMAVVDEQLRVLGVESLRIADASIMPRIVSGNTNSPTMMIAEKAARMMLARR